MDETRLRLPFKHAFICSGDDIRRITEILSAQIGLPVTIDASLNDGTQKSFASVQDLIAFKNPRTRRITSIELGIKVATPEYRYMEVEVSRSYSSEINITGRADDKTILLIRREFGEIVASLKAPFWWLSTLAVKGSIAGISGTLWMLGGAIFLGYQGNRLGLGAKHFSLMTLVVLGLTLLLIILSGIGVASVVQRLLDYIFPAGVILIGDEIGENQAREKRRNLFFVTIILTFVVSLGASIAANFIR